MDEQPKRRVAFVSEDEVRRGCLITLAKPYLGDLATALSIFLGDKTQLSCLSNEEYLRKSCRTANLAEWLQLAVAGQVFCRRGSGT